MPAEPLNVTGFGGETGSTRLDKEREETWIMRPLHMFALAAVAAFATLASPARADDNFDLTVSKGQVVVKAKAGWHINTEYSWGVNADKDGKKGDKEPGAKVALDKEHGIATITQISSGKHWIRGAVCSDSNCAPFSKDVTVP
jgi:hypothetical protein